MFDEVPDHPQGAINSTLHQDINRLAVNTNQRINDECSRTNKQIEELKEKLLVITVSGGSMIGTLFIGLVALTLR